MSDVKIMAVISVFGDFFDTNFVTKELMIEPTEIWRKGDQSKVSEHVIKKETCWQYSTGYAEGLYVEDQLNKLLELFGEKIETMKRIMCEFELECKIDIVIKGAIREAPSIFLSREIIRFSYTLNSPIDIDLYPYE